MRPVLRYFGGKNKLAPWIVSKLPQSKVYIEPYGGAASVLMHKERCQVEIYNDLDKEVVNVFVVLRDDVLFRRLHHKGSLTPFAEDEFKAARTKTTDFVEQARRTIVKSYFGVGADSIHRASGMRVYPHNRLGRGNDTICAAEWGTYWAEAVQQFHERLAPSGHPLRTTILSKPALDVMRMYEGPDTLVYCDPPYLHSTRTSNGRYAHEMTDDDHRAMLATLCGLRSMVVLSGYPSLLYDEMLVGWQRIERDFRGRTEVLWRNPAAVAAAHRQIAIPYPADDDEDAA